MFVYCVKIKVIEKGYRKGIDEGGCIILLWVDFCIDILMFIVIKCFEKCENLI